MQLALLEMYLHYQLIRDKHSNNKIINMTCKAQFHCHLKSNCDYLARHNRGHSHLVKEHKLTGVDTVWYKER